MSFSSDSEEEALFNRGSRGSIESSTPKRIYYLAVLAAFGGFLFGYDTGVVSGALLLLRSEFNLSDLWHELIVSGTLAAAFVTALAAGCLADRHGRRPTILVASLNFLLGSIVMAFAFDKVVLLAGRIIVGVGLGLASHTVPLYIGECSTPEMRGFLVTLNIVAVTFGQLCAGVVCGILVNTTNGWRLMLGLAALPASIQLFGFYFMPESPRYLVKVEKFAEAKAVLSSIRSPYHQIEDEIEDIKIVANEATATLPLLPFIRSLAADRQARLSVLLGCLLQLGQQAAGINTVMYYAASIIKMAGASDAMAVWFSSVTAGFNFLFTLVGLYLVRRVNRRSLLLGSLCLVVLALIAISVSFVYMGEGGAAGNSTSNSTGPGVVFMVPDKPSYSGPILVLSSLCLYIIAFAPGMGPLPWLINSELHPSGCRANALSLSTATNWISNLIVSLTFLSLVGAIGRPLTFVLYAGLTSLAGIILYFYLPETKGVKLEEAGGLFEREGSRARGQGDRTNASSGGVVYTSLRAEGDD